MIEKSRERNFWEDWDTFREADDPLRFNSSLKNNGSWTRFHALPNAKRFATTNDEQKVVLKRANTIGGELFGVGSEVWCVSLQFRDFRARPAGLLHGWPSGSLKLQHSVVGDPYVDEDVTVDVYAGLDRWEPGRFDAQLLEIADAALNAFWFEPSEGIVFKPYDGGFDLYMKTAELFSRLENRYVDWMSTRDDKL
ncbi:hypothetical protein TL5118_02603 [Thalassovita autumnalis]|uniref:DUF3885 domain-containing protein n=1 Tax=Thalassovita autumnalis TaxID=2072972 RepID=A0A0P1FKS6_9RHOB|nr:hypothetical protein [Thalassovita autumnalis]CUH68349.1 hypothetical protein TL5118_02603 [Thalassovita autumnalis]CUH73473.1 hypothetical protein TL5120_03282 [Thalassovita autumnalis]